MLLDEPDLHIHVAMVDQLLETLERVIQERHGQLIVASHSPFGVQIGAYPAFPIKTYLDRSDAPAGWQYTMAEAALVSLFIFLTVVYASATLVNSRVLGS